MLSYDELRLLRAFRALPDDDARNIEIRVMMLRAKASLDESEDFDTGMTAQIIKFPKKKARRKRVVNLSTGTGGQVIGLCDGRSMNH